MSVVLRCPNCGTTRATPGECEACHEGSVRYFCSNHQPGLWLSEPTCAKCGAAFGQPARAPSATRPRPLRPAARAAAVAPVREVVTARPVLPAAPPASGPGSPRAEPPVVYEEALEPREPTMAP